MRARGWITAAAVALLAAGCGAEFELPTEQPVAEIVPSDGSYAMLATWRNQDGIQDLLITQGLGSQLFVLFNRGGSGGPAIPRGEVNLYQFTRPNPIGPPYFEPLTTLFNPVAITATRDFLFVLDQGDTCMARYDPAQGSCQATSTFNNRIRDLSAYWRVREFDLSGGDTISTFTDTTFAQVYGVAADDQGNVYVSGIAAVLDTLATDQRIRTRKFVSRVYRYRRGHRYPGVEPPDVFMPGSNWHRDTTWVVFDGTGTSSVVDPRGIAWLAPGTPELFIADKGNNQAKTVSVSQIGVGYTRFDGRETDSNFLDPTDVAIDLQGYLYVVDRGNRRVVRYDRFGNYIQTVNVEPNADGQSLLDAVCIAVDDSLAYVGDRGRNQIIRYKRRP